MAAVAIAGVSHYIGTAAERAALSTTGVPAGSTFYETDTPALYIWDGSAWAEHIAKVQTGDTINIANIGGLAAHDAAASGNPVQVGGVYRASDPAVVDGDMASLRVNAKGEALVQLTGSITPTHTAVNVTATTGQVLAANANRKYALLINDSEAVIYLKIGAAAVLNQGIRLNANGGSYEMASALGNLATGAINGIHGSSGNKVLTVLEGV